MTVNEQGLRQLASLLHNSRSAIEATSVIEYHRDDHQQLHFDASVGKAAYKRTPFRRVRADRKKLCNVLRHGLHVLVVDLLTICRLTTMLTMLCSTINHWTKWKS